MVCAVNSPNKGVVSCYTAQTTFIKSLNMLIVNNPSLFFLKTSFSSAYQFFLLLRILFVCHHGFCLPSLFYIPLMLERMIVLFFRVFSGIVLILVELSISEFPPI